MDKSIEEVWSKGFIKESNTAIPKINSLFNQKSKNVIEQMARLAKWNIIFLYAMVVVILIMAFLLSLPIWLTITLVLMFAAPAVYTQMQVKSGFPKENYQNCYDYLTVIRGWISTQLNRNIKLARIYYPVSVLSAGSIIWFSEGREKVMEKIMSQFPDLILIFGVPIYFIAPIFLFALLLGIFAEKVYRFDVGLIYGRALSRLDEIISDLEELR